MEQRANVRLLNEKNPHSPFTRVSTTNPSKRLKDFGRKQPKIFIGLNCFYSFESFQLNRIFWPFVHVMEVDWCSLYLPRIHLHMIRFEKWNKVLDDTKKPFYRWFSGGVLNTCYNCLDVHIANGRGNNIALIYDSPVTVHFSFLFIVFSYSHSFLF